MFSQQNDGYGAHMDSLHQNGFLTHFFSLKKTPCMDFFVFVATSRRHVIDVFP
jgi:hypothetical protein